MGQFVSGPGKEGGLGWGEERQGRTAVFARVQGKGGRLKGEWGRVSSDLWFVYKVGVVYMMAVVNVDADGTREGKWASRV